MFSNREKSVWFTASSTSTAIFITGNILLLYKKKDTVFEAVNDNVNSLSGVASSSTIDIMYSRKTVESMHSVIDELKQIKGYS